MFKPKHNPHDVAHDTCATIQYFSLLHFKLLVISDKYKNIQGEFIFNLNSSFNSERIARLRAVSLAFKRQVQSVVT